MWDRLFSSVDLLQKGVEASWLRETVILNNIANAETPGFKSSDVNFESIFTHALTNSSFDSKVTREKHRNISGGGSVFDVQATVSKNTDTSMLFNDNNVDIEAENVKLAQNSIYYNTLVSKMNSELSRIKLAISEGS